jgi:hypothetical protein
VNVHAARVEVHAERVVIHALRGDINAEHGEFNARRGTLSASSVALSATRGEGYTVCVEFTGIFGDLSREEVSVSEAVKDFFNTCQ